MKKFFILPALVLMALPASAGQIMPNLYAQEFCELRDMGVSLSEARTAAFSTTYVNSLPDLPTVTVYGVTVTADIVNAYREVSERCPEHL